MHGRCRRDRGQPAGKGGAHVRRHRNTRQRSGLRMCWFARLLNPCSGSWARASGPKPWRKPLNAGATRRSCCDKQDLNCRCRNDQWLDPAAPEKFTDHVQRGYFCPVDLSRPVNDLATSRAHSMKRSTTGLNVRPFNVTMATGQALTGKSTGSTFKSSFPTWSEATVFGSTVTNGPFVRKCMTSGNEKVINFTFGMPSPRARNALATNA